MAKRKAKPAAGKRKLAKTSETRDLTPTETRALGFLLEGRTITETAEAAGVNRNTIRAWTNNPGPFRDAYQSALSAMVREVGNVIMACATSAVAALRQVMAKGDTDASRVSAAKAILDRIPAADSLTGAESIAAAEASFARIEEIRAQRQAELRAPR